MNQICKKTYKFEIRHTNFSMHQDVQEPTTWPADELRRSQFAFEDHETGEETNFLVGGCKHFPMFHPI